jgi:hypothetical protein
MAYRYVFVSDDWQELEAKGWTSVKAISDTDAARRFTINVYDPTRLAQSIETEMATGKHHFFDPNIVVVPVMSRATVEGALAQLAVNDFSGMAEDSAGNESSSS